MMNIRNHLQIDHLACRETCGIVCLSEFINIFYITCAGGVKLILKYVSEARYTDLGRPHHRPIISYQYYSNKFACPERLFKRRFACITYLRDDRAVPL